MLAWVYLGDRALVREGAVMGEGAGFAMRLIVESTNRSGACYPSFSQAQEAVIEALQMSKLIAYGLENGEGDLKEIPALLWADLKFWWNPDHAGPRDCFRLGASRWVAFRIKRKAILAIWLDPLQSVAMADEQKTSTAAQGNANVEPLTPNKHEDLFRLRPPAPGESESHSTLPSALASKYSARLAKKRWSEPNQKREAVLGEAESVARRRWKDCDDDHAKMTSWLQYEYSSDDKTLPFASDTLTNHLLKRMANVAREIGKPVRGEKKSHG